MGNIYSVMDECFTWKAHVNHLLVKVGKIIDMLGREGKNIFMHSANIVYKSYIISVLDYCDTVWSCQCGNVNSDKLEKLQRRAARIIMKSDRSKSALFKKRYLKSQAREKCPQFLLTISNLVEYFVQNYSTK